MALVYLNAAMLIYVTYHKPFDRRARNLTELMNECTIFVSTESMLFYTDLLDVQGQNHAGWFIVGFFLMNITINLLIVLYTTCGVLRRNTVRAWRHTRHKCLSRASVHSPEAAPAEVLV